MDSLSVEMLKQHLDYDPGTGIFTRRIQARGRRSDVGCRAGGASHGYRYIRVCTKRYAEHQLAWLYMTGKWPEFDIDHINLDKGDNKFANLREATRSQNMANTDTPRNNKSGMKGVHFDKANDKWLAHMQVNRQFKNLGRYDTFEEAAAVRLAAFEKTFGQFARMQQDGPHL